MFVHCTYSSVINCMIKCTTEATQQCTGFQVDNDTNICTIGAIVRKELIEEVDGDTLYVKDTLAKMDEGTNDLKHSRTKQLH